MVKLVDIKWKDEVITQLTKPQIQRILKDKFESAKAHLIMSFNLHEVTRAIEENESFAGGTIRGFFGFDPDIDPIEPIREYLEEEIQFGRVEVVGKSVVAHFTLPLAATVFEMTSNDLEWVNGRSWARMIETGGIAGVGQYLGNQGIGRSDEGIQVKGQLRSGKYGPKKYISHLFSNFEKDIKKSIKL